MIFLYNQSFPDIYFSAPRAYVTHSGLSDWSLVRNSVRTVKFLPRKRQKSFHVHNLLGGGGGGGVTSVYVRLCPVLFGFYETTDVFFGTLADIDGHWRTWSDIGGLGRTLADSDGHWRTLIGLQPIKTRAE